jgi:transposase
MWTVQQRQAHDRAGLRYPSDLTGAESALVAPLIPPAKQGGRKRTVDARAVLDGIFYVLATGCRWRALPKDLPPKSTAHDYLTLWAWDGTLRRLHHALFVQVRESAGREASPTVAIIASQSVRSAENGALGSIRRVATRARRSRARSGTSWSTRSACCWAPWSIPPAPRTGTGPCRSCAPRAGWSRSSR